MQSVAKAVGVSTMTVSRVLRNRPEIKKETRDRVWQEISAQGYRPNPLVSALMTQLRTNTVVQDGAVLALVHCLPEGTTLAPNMKTFKVAVKARARELGYGLIEFYLRDFGMVEARLMQILESRGIRGVIFEHFFQHGQRLRFDFSKFACVAIGPSILSPEFHRIESDRFREMQMALDQAQARGYRRIGFTTLREVELLLDYQRFAALSLAQSYWPEADRVPWLEVQRVEDYRDAIVGWYRTHKPDVILTQSPRVYEYLIEAGLRVPEDVGFLHLGYNKEFQHLGGVDPNWRQRGISAVDRVVEQMNRNEFGVPKNPMITYVKSRWIEGPSLRPRGGGQVAAGPHSKSAG